MSVDALSAGLSADTRGLAGLRVAARDNDPEAIRQVAGQFEALFVQMMVQSMRQASLGEGLLDNDQTQLYQGMYDQQIASQIGGQGGIGLAEAIVRQLSRAAPEAADASAPVAPARVAAAVAPFAGPEDFTRRLWPEAEAAAARLGVNPETLIAQAALETGWGQKVVATPDGASSHNLFNIKADGRWDGASAATRTLEYRDGVAVRELASFRCYDSPAASFDDYVNFLQAQPRYAQALATGDDGYIAALAAAGYATDPAYAAKVQDILARPQFRAVVAELKSGAQAPIA